MPDELDLNPSLEASLDDLKAVYRILAENRDEYTELVHNAFYQSLHRLLEAQATVEGVDVSVDAEWDAWLRLVDEPAAPEKRSDLLN